MNIENTKANEGQGGLNAAVKSEKALLETAMLLIGASVWLRNNIEGILNDPRQSIFYNQIINALRIGLQLKNGDINLGMLAPMQSGKSGTVYFLCNYVLRDIGYLADCEHAAFVTSMRDASLYSQNNLNLGEEPYDYANRCNMPSNIIVFKIDVFFKRPNPYKAVADSNIKFVIRDEDQYGAGAASTFDEGFFNKLRVQLPKMPLLSVSATPYDILDAKDKGYPVNIIEGERPTSYFGISEMLACGLVEDLPANFNVFEKASPNRNDIKLHSKVEEYTDHLLSFKSGIGIVRVKNSGQAQMLRQMIRSIYQNQLDCIFIGSVRECDFTISQGIEEAYTRVIKQGKRVFMIIVQALGAGKDFKMLKEYIRFGIETRESQLANVAQGLPGRFCGYHKNRTFKLLACETLLTQYSEFENDTNIFYDDEWRRGLFINQVSDLTTQCSLALRTKPGVKTKVEEKTVFTFEELNTLSVQNEVVAKIGINNFNRLMEAFDWKRFDRKAGGENFRLNDVSEQITIRVASSYGTDSHGNNRLYTIWRNVTDDSDFGSVFFKKKDYAYGILCSNYPMSDLRNTLGFCGIMLVKAGEKISQSLTVDTENGSMYTAA